MQSKENSNAMPKRGDVWLILFDPQKGAEVKKSWPAVIMSIDSTGKVPLRIVVPITHWRTDFVKQPWLIHIKPDKLNKLEKDSAADAFQVKSVSLKRFIKPLGMLNSKVVDDIAAAVALCVGTTFANTED